MEKLNIRTLEKILNKIRYPSGDNAQPFDFVFKDNVLQILFCADRADHKLDLDQLASCMTLGCLLESIREVALYEGYEMRYELTSMDSQSSVWCRVWFQLAVFVKPSAQGIDSLQKRFTFRGVFANRPIPQGFLNWLSQNEILHSTSIPDSFIQSVRIFDQIFWKDQEAVRDLFKMIRFTRNNYQQKKDGIYWKELGIKSYEVPMMYLIKLFPSFPKWTYNFLYRFAIDRLTRRNLQSSGLVVVLPIKKDILLDKIQRRKAYVQLGYKGMEIWLKATEFNLGLQPLTLISMLGNLDLLGLEDFFHLNEKEQAQLHQSHLDLLHFFRLDQDCTLGWVLRLGCLNEKAQNGAVSLRRSIRLG